MLLYIHRGNGACLLCLVNHDRDLRHVESLLFQIAKELPYRPDAGILASAGEKDLIAHLHRLYHTIIAP